MFTFKPDVDREFDVAGSRDFDCALQDISSRPYRTVAVPLQPWMRTIAVIWQQDPVNLEQRIVQ